MNRGRGFTIFEILITISIFIIIFGIGTFVFVNARRQSGLNALGDSIVATLELAKANAITSLNGDPFGVNVGTTAGTSSYIYFEGSSYKSSDSRNDTFAVSSPYNLFATTTPTGGIIIFAHRTGIPNATSTITVMDPSNATHPQIITVGSLGDINISR